MMVLQVFSNLNDSMILLGREEMASSCIRGGLDWLLGNLFYDSVFPSEAS